MTGLAMAGLLVALAVTGLVVERRRAPAGSDDERRRARGRTFAWGSMMVTLPPLACVVAFALVSTMSYGPDAPVDPYGSAEPWNLSLDFGGTLALAVGVLVAALVAVAGLAYLVGARRSAMERGLGPPNGSSLLRTWSVVTGSLAFLALLRVLAGGASPTELRWHGSLVVPGDAGFTVEATLSRVTEGEPHEVVEGASVADDAKRWRSRDCCGLLATPGGARSSDGLHAWLGDVPVVLTRTDDGVTMHRVLERAPGLYDEGPRFEGMPQWYRVRGRWDVSEEADDRVLLVDRSAGTRAVMLGRYGTKAVTVSEVGLCAAPPWWPLAVTGGLLVLVLAVGRGVQTRQRPGPRRFAMATLLSLAAALLSGVLAPYFGLG